MPIKSFPVTMGRSGIQMIEKLNLRDHIWGICNLNRFCGKGDRQVSIGVHSLHCFELARIWQPENTNLQLYALLHDLPEGYYNDIPGFLKKTYGPEFKLVNDEIDEIMLSQSGLPADVRIVNGDNLHRIDYNALTIEASYVFDKFEPYHWPPMDLYDEQDILIELSALSVKSVYNEIISKLETFGETNEVLRNTLYRA